MSIWTTASDLDLIREERTAFGCGCSTCEYGCACCDETLAQAVATCAGDRVRDLEPIEIIDAKAFGLTGPDAANCSTVDLPF